MTLEQTRRQFLAGELEKHEYITRMHDLHARLLEYPSFIKDADVASITIQPDGVVLKTRHAGIELVLNSADERLIPLEIMNFGGYESDETAMVLRLAEQCRVIFDIGSNIGWYSIAIAKHRGSSASVHAFEPIPSTYDQLVRNLAVNRVETTVTALNVGMSDTSSEKTFFFYPQGSGNASTADLSGRDDVERILCRVRTIDDYVEETGVVPELIKCDVEGAEFFVFKGGMKTLASARPIVFTEMLRKWTAAFDYTPNDIIDWFAALGYGCFVLREDRLEAFGRMNDETRDTNFLFLHGEKHASQIAALVD